MKPSRNKSPERIFRINLTVPTVTLTAFSIKKGDTLVKVSEFSLRKIVPIQMYSNGAPLGEKWTDSGLRPGTKNPQDSMAGSIARPGQSREE
ncbi:hypothetical protein TNCV_3693001 [Trichonephila clavipes]|nr:hypothetical protein TNCV_3693001 [Trichonephila clavipes]